MSNKLYVGGLSYATTNEALGTLFQEAGEVVSAQVVIDRDTGRSKGFGFVEMYSEEDATNAVTKFNGIEFDKRTLTVNEARAREPRRANSSRW